MNNLPIISNNSQPPTKTANKSQANNGAQGSQAAKPFGSVLAQQIEKPHTQSPAAQPSEKPAADAKKSTNAKDAANKGEKDKSAVPAVPNDPSGALVAMLQLPTEIKTPVTGDTATAGNAATPSNITAALGELASSKTKAGANQPAINLSGGAASAKFQADTKADMANIPFGKTDAAMTLADAPQLRGQSGAEAIQNAVLADSIPGAAQAAQTSAQSAASLAASGLMPNTLTNNKPVDTPATISAPVGSSKWGDEFSQKISWMSTQQNQVAELHLNPPDLGPLDVVLKVTDNQATALFTSPHSAVREAVENSLPKLREILADSGITLGNATVSDQAPRDNNPGGFNEQRGNNQAGRSMSGGIADTANSPIMNTQPIAVRRHNGMVDTFA